MSVVQAKDPPLDPKPGEFDIRVAKRGRPGLYSARVLDTVQVNIGLRCNLVCGHCHVNSSPRRKEQMDWDTMRAVLRVARDLNAGTVDVTGGAPEMNPHFKRFVSAARKQAHEVIVRSNLTILLEPGYEDLIDFFQAHRVQLVASLPCYLEQNVDRQRGAGVYQDSLRAIRKLNDAGYGVQAELPLTLVYNPGGPSLPPDQAALEKEYRQELGRRFGIRFTRLSTITNAPIGRFRGDLRKGGRLDSYRELLRQAYNPATVDSLMCRRQISVGWDGTLYDCDFNLALGLPLEASPRAKVGDVSIESLLERRVITRDHCHACTAGAGSSCAGALVADES